ncbi:MAG: hypothetical protein ABIR79_18240, partial [Candidatus Binatia bacterium]
MKLVAPIMGIIAGVILLVPAERAGAQPVDCEAARCTIQAAIDAECSCADAKNHGRYTSCVARVVNRSAREGLVPKKCRNKINGCAIRSTCGKREGSVSCDFPGDGPSGRCRPLASDETCTNRGGTVVASCCDSCEAPVPTATPTEGAPVATATPAEPVATATTTPEEPVATATPEEPVATATPEGPVATATESPVATATEGPVATATPAEPVATATPEGPIATATEGTVATATPAEPIATPTATEGPVATATEEPVATPTVTATAVETPNPTSTPGPEPTSSVACSNNTVDTGEDCDPPGQPVCPNAGNGLEICSVGCQCLCPSRLSFTGDATDPASLLDTGWTGIAHRAPVISNGDVTVDLACAAEGRPCGTCPLTGPIPNTLPNQLDNQRCTNDTAIKCTDDTPCTGGGGTCQFFFGSTLPLAAGGVGTCVVNQFDGPITGTANIESGEAATTALLSSRVYTGPTDNPCPRCSDNGVINDGLADGGTCDSGPNSGDPCDANGFVPGRPDFGRTSLDCPPDPGTLVATLPIDLSNATDTVTKTLSASSPNCGDGSGEKCLCDTCNNAAATPCDGNEDCTAVGATICGGRRCLGGDNNGGVCTSSAVCTGGGLCGKAGEPSKPTACLDDTSTVGVLDCTDTAPVDQEGECSAGPVTKTCSVASGHGQRACGSDGDCGGGAGSCVAANRGCFLTGGFTGKIGTNTLIAEGVEDPPVNDVS